MCHAAVDLEDAVTPMLSECLPHTGGGPERTPAVSGFSRTSRVLTQTFGQEVTRAVTLRPLSPPGV